MAGALRRVLIANRGEIAVRVIRACRELGLETVAVYSTADREALHTKLADTAVCIGPPAASASYLNGSALIAAAQQSGADSIHPGYGFLSESPEFAEACAEHDLRFVGPPAQVMRQVGDKAEARRLMEEAGLEIVPGSGAITDEADLRLQAEQVGFPLMLKAIAGGGGRGIKIVRERDAIVEAWHLARREAEAAFGDGGIYLERYIDRARHVEVQVLCDGQGGAIHLGERECSIQRRHQKLIEEARSVLPEDAASELCAAAAAAAQQIGYENAGTLEFLVSPDGEVFFIEINARVQVEHTVSEMVTGVDIVQQQLLIAGGRSLPYTQEDIVFRGHAIQCRINAEHPETRVPSPGKIAELHLPGGCGVRVDTALYPGYTVPPYYDSLIAKLVVHAEARPLAIARMRAALRELRVVGIETNAALHQKIIGGRHFADGTIDTGLLERWPYAEGNSR